MKGGYRPGSGRKKDNEDRPVSRLAVYPYEDQAGSSEEIRKKLDIATLAQFRVALANRIIQNDLITHFEVSTEPQGRFTLGWRDGGTCEVNFYDDRVEWLFTDPADRDDYWDMFPGSLRETDLYYLLIVPAKVAGEWLKTL